MTRFLDGPTAGVILSLRRAPLYLRVVRDAAGKWDALDQLDDTPTPGEAVVAVYRLEGTPSVCFIDGVRNRRRVGWRELMASYRAVGEQPDLDVVRDTAAWRAWCVKEQAKEKSHAV